MFCSAVFRNAWRTPKNVCVGGYVCLFLPIFGQGRGLLQIFPAKVQNAGKTFALIFERDKYLCSLTVALFVSEHKPHSKIKRFYSWFCGYEAGTEEAKKAAHEQHERLQHLTSLERNRYAETFLNINVLIVMAIGLYLFIFFSI